MAQQSPGFDMSKLSTSDKLVLGGAGIYIIWAFLPFWYKWDLGVVGSSSFSGFRGLLILAWLAALAAVAEIVLRKMAGMNLNLPIKAGLLHLVLGGVGAVLTLLGLVIRPSVIVATASISWGLFVAIILAGVWAYGAYMMYSEPDTSAGGGGTPPPPPPAGGDSSGFSS